MKVTLTVVQTYVTHVVRRGSRFVSHGHVLEFGVDDHRHRAGIVITFTMRRVRRVRGEWEVFKGTQGTVSLRTKSPSSYSRSGVSRGRSITGSRD